MTVRIAAIVVTHRADDLLDRCLASLDAQSRPPDERVVVVSNEARAVPGPALQLGANVGYAKAANAGARATTGELLLLNDDTTLELDCIEALERAWRGPAVYQPRIDLADGSGRLDNVGHGFFPDGFVWARGRAGRAVPRGAPGGFSGAAALVARSAWEALGGFDERFDSFGEDVDLSLRLMRRGIPVVPVPDARVSHVLGATYGRAGPEKLARIERNRLRAAVRSLPLGALVAMPALTGARLALLAGLAASGRGPGRGVPADARRAALRGIAEGLADAPTWWAERRRDRDAWTLGEVAMWRALWRGRARWEDVCRSLD